MGDRGSETERQAKPNFDDSATVLQTVLQMLAKLPADQRAALAGVLGGAGDDAVPAGQNRVGRD